MVAKTMEELVSLCKRRGFIFQSNDIYGGIKGLYDYGPMGVELKNIQEQIHQNFINYVQSRRGHKLNKDKDDEIFSGLFWVGQKGVDLGLADGIGHINEIIEKKYGKKAKIKIIEQKKSFLQRKLSSKLLHTDDLIQSLEEKALWSRYGL